MLQSSEMVCRDEGGVFLLVSTGYLGLHEATMAAETWSELSVP